MCRVDVTYQVNCQYVTLTGRQRSLDRRRSRCTMAHNWLSRAVAASRRYLGAHPRRARSGSDDPDSRTRKFSPEDDVGAYRRAKSQGDGPPLRFQVSVDSRWPAKISVRVTLDETTGRRRNGVGPISMSFGHVVKLLEVKDTLFFL